MSRVLFVMLHPGFIRYYDEAIVALADAGHDVHVAFEISRTKLGENETARQLASRAPRITCGVAPTRAESVRTFLARSDRTATRSGGAALSLLDAGARRDAWESAATTERLLLDYIRYFEPAFAGAHALRARAEKRLPHVYRRWARLAARGGRFPRRLLSAALSGAERMIPANGDVEAFLREQAPDLLLVTPLIELGSQQVDYIKAARRLGIRSALCVASWDNLTSKGLIRVVPDHVLVWNEAQKREATELHGVPPDRVVITGAQLFDRWFAATPRLERAAFCDRVGLDPARPFILYVGSSTFIAPDEVPFAERWVAAVRGAADPRVARAGILIRPHPANADQWRAFDMRAHGDIALWPPIGTDPNAAAFRADFFDSLYHSAAVVGINTSAQIEAGIVGRPVLTITAPEFAHAQAGTLHFQHLVGPEHGLVRTATSLAAHAGQLSEALADGDRAAAANRRFVHAFIRPHGLDRPATPIFVDAVTALAARPRTAPQADPAWVRLARPPALLAAWAARALAEDRPLWVYAVRPFITAGVWICALGYVGGAAWQDYVRRPARVLQRTVRRALYESRQQTAKRVRRLRKPVAAILRGAARRFLGRVA